MGVFCCSGCVWLCLWWFDGGCICVWSVGLYVGGVVGAGVSVVVFCVWGGGVLLCCGCGWFRPAGGWVLCLLCFVFGVLVWLLIVWGVFAC